MLQPKKIWASLWRGLFTIVAFPVALLYGVGISLRNFLYDRRWLPVHRLPCHVVSVGNLSVGGSGKTPFTLYLIQWLNQKGIKVAYLSRGYRRKTRGFLEVSLNTLEPAQKYGDEAVLAKLRFPEVPVAVAEDRFQGGLELLQRHPDLQILVLDDGFQHRSLHRDLDILIVDALQPPKQDWLLPLGRLREPLRSYRRADLIIFNQKNTPSRKLRTGWLRKAGKPVLRFHYEARELISAFTELPNLTLDSLRYKNAFAFCGIATPQSFLDTLRAMQVYVLHLESYPDHQALSVREAEALARRYQRLKRLRNLPELLLLTTEKDLARLYDSPALSAFSGLPLYALRIYMQPDEPEHAHTILSNLFASLLNHDHTRSIQPLS